ncbi:hypothetical protein BDV93DRAFT_524321 [Ceratobasidium sp. AG-I]|nr:hypothetical protein BDV93DRAFT_524321 [Ceratobasidium sp. AG-I]
MEVESRARAPICNHTFGTGIPTNKSSLTVASVHFSNASHPVSDTSRAFSSTTHCASGDWRPITRTRSPQHIVKGGVTALYH